MVALTFVLATALPHQESSDEETFHSAEDDSFHSAEGSQSSEEEVFYSAEENPVVDPKLKPKPQPSS